MEVGRNWRGEKKKDSLEPKRSKVENHKVRNGGNLTTNAWKAIGWGAILRGIGSSPPIREEERDGSRVASILRGVRIYNYRGDIATREILKVKGGVA